MQTNRHILVAIRFLVILYLANFFPANAQAQTFTPISSPTTAYTSSTKVLPTNVPDFTIVTSVTDGNQTVTFSIPMQALTVPTSWSTWNSPPNTESSTPRVLWTGGATSVTLTLANPATVFGFEAEPNPFSVHTITAAFMSGSSTVGTVARPINGFAGALLAAASSGQPITSIRISCDADFAIAQIRSGCTTPVTSVTVTTNKNCDSTINPNCSANIVLADGFETSEINTSVQPPEAVFVGLSATFGNVRDVRTDSSGKAISLYTSGTMTLGGTNTTTAALAATICNKVFPNLERVFNYRGFNFHQSNVTDTAFTDSTAMDAPAIQAFFASRHSFLANLIIVGTLGGFLDVNGNGHLDPGEPTYSASGRIIPLHAGGTTAANLFAGAGTDQGLNPKILLVTAEKENSLISSSTLPSASVLNFAMGCGSPSTFAAQIRCAAKTFVNRFDDTQAFGRTITYPFFFHAVDGIRHAASDNCVPAGLPGCISTGFLITGPSIYAQYRYTPYIQALTNGGGVYRFEALWQAYDF